MGKSMGKTHRNRSKKTAVKSGEEQKHSSRHKSRIINYVNSICDEVKRILLHGKFKLLDEDLLEGVEVILLIENEHCFLEIWER